MKIMVYTLDNEPVEEIALNAAVFGIETNPEIITRVVNWQRAKRQSGTHSTKGISEISGSGRKPYRQKGTGRARLGSLRTPQARGGAVIFGPKPRDHSHRLLKKVRKLGLKMALSTKFQDNTLRVIQSLDLESQRTQLLKEKFRAMESALVVESAEFNVNFGLAIRNIPRFDILPVRGVNVYDILNHKYLILSRSAVDTLEERLI